MEQERQKFSGFDLCRTTLRRWRGLGYDDDDDDVVTMIVMMTRRGLGDDDDVVGELSNEYSQHLVGDWWTCRMS